MPGSLRSLLPTRAVSLAARAALLSLLAGACWWAQAEDWPEWRGKGRHGVWNETGIVDTFPEQGLPVSWKHPVKAGYAGPAVAAGRVFVTDFARGQGNRGVERVLCLREDSGKLLWSREWDADYAGLQYELGPRATPTVDGDRVYTLGATGVLHCLNSQTGEVIWRKDYRQDYDADLPPWGMVGAPLVEGDQLICLVGGKPNAKVVSLDKRTGEETWRALDSASEPGYSPPIVMDAGGQRQLIIWHPKALVSLEPMTGKVLWEHPFSVNAGLTVATPVIDGPRLLVSSFYNGSRLFRLPDTAPASAELVWKGNSDSEIETDGLHSLISTPVIDGDYIYGICSYGQFRCIDARSGRRVWETMDVTLENERWATGLIVRHQDRYFINNDRGDLILAKLSPEGYQEISRTKLIRPTNPTQRKRAMDAVHWSHPAYANRHILVRNDEEIVRYSLEK